MSEPKHTPGPWTVRPETLHRPTAWGIDARHGNPGIHLESWTGLAVVYGDRDCWSPKNKSGEANAHLIAAAPDLLDALRLVVEEIDDDSRQIPGAIILSNPCKVVVRAAIAKAEGVFDA